MRLLNRTILSYFFLASLVILGVDAASTTSFTLEQIMSAPFPTQLVTSPSGDRVAWVFNEQGRRNIWLAEGPEYKAKRVTHYDKDDGQEISGLEFSRDGSMIVYARGGSPNSQGTSPNPTSDPRGAEQAVWAVKTSGGPPWRLGAGAHPSVSPREDVAVFLNQGQIFKARIDEATESTLFFKARGKNGSPVWSPDGSILAFVSSRDDHSFIGLYHLDKDRITWVEPSVDRDQDPVWSQDGKQVAFFRFPGRAADAPRGREWKLTFALWVADADTGRARRVWRSPNESGGFAQYYPAHPLMWGAQNRLIFTSEHDGWLHLYSVSLAGGKAISLTPGEYEVEDCTLSPDRQTIIFNANKGDLDRRHLWSVPGTGGSLQQLTEGEGLEWSPAVTASGKDVVFLCSTAFQPAAPAIMNLSGRKRRLLAPRAIPDEFPLRSLVEPRPVIFSSPDGLNIHGQLFLPQGMKAGDQRPAVIFMHGGPIRQMMLGWHMRGYYHNAYAMNQYLTSRGYVVLSVNYRSGIGYGRAFRTAPDQGPRGASEYQDIVAAARYLQQLPDVDADRIGLWGGSYGGYLTALGLARDSELFKAGVDLHGVHDWSLRGRRRAGGGWALFGEDQLRLAYNSSPVADVRFWYSPVLLIHGDDDRNVDFIQTTDLVQRLRREGKAHVETLIFPDEVHGFLRHDRWIQAYRAAADFFDRFLMRKQPSPSNHANAQDRGRRMD